MAFDPSAIEQAITNGIIRMIPFFGPAFADMTPDQKRAFLLQLAEVLARGAAEGAVKGNQGSTGGIQIP